MKVLRRIFTYSPRGRKLKFLSSSGTLPLPSYHTPRCIVREYIRQNKVRINRKLSIPFFPTPYYFRYEESSGHHYRLGNYCSFVLEEEGQQREGFGNWGNGGIITVRLYGNPTTVLSRPVTRWTGVEVTSLDEPNWNHWVRFNNSLPEVNRDETCLQVLPKLGYTCIFV